MKKRPPKVAWFVMWVPWSVTSTSLICDVSSLIYDAKPTVLGFRVWGQGLTPTVRNRTVRPIRSFRPSEPYHWTFNSCFVFKLILVQGLRILRASAPIWTCPWVAAAGCCNRCLNGFISHAQVELPWQHQLGFVGELEALIRCCCYLLLLLLGSCCLVGAVWLLLVSCCVGCLSSVEFVQIAWRNAR